MTEGDNDTKPSSDSSHPQEDPRRRNFSFQYDYSLHSVPIGPNNKIDKVQSHGSKHQKRRKRRLRRGKQHSEVEDVNPTDVVAEILGNFSSAKIL